MHDLARQHRMAQRLAQRTARVLGNVIEASGVIGRGQLIAPTEELIGGNVISTGWTLTYPWISSS